MSKNQILEALNDIKNLLVKSNETNKKNDDENISDDFNVEIVKNVFKKLDEKENVFKILGGEDFNENFSKEKVNNIDFEEKDKIKIPKMKDLYNYINSNGEFVGEFYGTEPKKVARKVANKIYHNTNKHSFELKIYNRMKDKIYTYKALIKDCKKFKKIGDNIIPITHDIKIVRS